MYTLISGLVEWATAKEEVRVILLGLDGAGKTTTLQALRAAADRRARGRHSSTSSANAEPLPKARPTVGLNVGRLDTAGAAVMLWDLGGAAGLRVIWDRYIRDAHGIIFVVDASNPARFAEARAVLERLVSSPDAAGAPLLIVANKEDAGGGAASASDVAAALGPVAREGVPGAPVRPKVVAASAVETALGSSSSSSVSAAARKGFGGGGGGGSASSSGGSRAGAATAATATAAGAAAAAANAVNAAASSSNGNGTASSVDVGTETLEEALRWIVDASRRGGRAEMLRERAAAGS